MHRLHSFLVSFFCMLLATNLFTSTSYAANEEWDRAEVRGGEIVDGKIIFCYRLSAGNMNLRLENYGQKSYRRIEFRVTGEYKRSSFDKWYSFTENKTWDFVEPMKNGKPDQGWFWDIIKQGNDDKVDLRSVKVVIISAEENK